MLIHVDLEFSANYWPNLNLLMKGKESKLHKLMRSIRESLWRRRLSLCACWAAFRITVPPAWSGRLRVQRSERVSTHRPLIRDKAGLQICLDSDALSIVPHLHASAQQEALICWRASEDTVKTGRQAITIITAFQPSVSRELCSFSGSVWFQMVSTTGWRVSNNVFSSMKKQGLSADEVKYHSILLKNPLHDLTWLQLYHVCEQMPVILI